MFRAGAGPRGKMFQAGAGPYGEMCGRAGASEVGPGLIKDKVNPESFSLSMCPTGLARPATLVRPGSTAPIRQSNSVHWHRPPAGTRHPPRPGTPPDACCVAAVFTIILNF